jgi:hypothetical protein
MADSSDHKRVTQAAEIFNELRTSGRSSEEIFVTLYGDLKQLASMKVSRQPPGASMHATRLPSDLYLRLFGKRYRSSNGSRHDTSSTPWRWQWSNC